jgi:hypothetical protein
MLLTLKRRYFPAKSIYLETVNFLFQTLSRKTEKFRQGKGNSFILVVMLMVLSLFHFTNSSPGTILAIACGIFYAIRK